MGENDYFGRALSDFVSEFAGGAAIRHMADMGLTVSEIHDKLSFPMPKKKIGEIVWKHFIETGRICLEKPKEGGKLQKISYVTDYGKYGSVSMRRVVEETDMPAGKYIECSFGKRIYQDGEKFFKEIEVLSDRERDYIMQLPWPLDNVYHEADEMIENIYKKLMNSENK